MIKKYFYTAILCCLFSAFTTFSQEKEIPLKTNDTLANTPYIFNPLSPSKAAFYAAILPGLGQAYNKKYWKIPLVYAALGSGVYFYRANNKNYHRVREAYKLRINGNPDEFDGLNGNPYISKDGLVTAQKTYKKNKDLSLLVSIGLYVLQILEASTNAHLLQHNVDNNLSISPKLIKNLNSHKRTAGIAINFKF